MSDVDQRGDTLRLPDPHHDERRDWRERGEHDPVDWAAQPEPHRRQPSLLLVALVAALTAAIVAAAVAVPLAGLVSDPDVPAAGTSADDGARRGPVEPAEGQSVAAAVAEAILPSVAQVETPQGAGSAVVYREDGYLLTNAHVVGEFSEVRVVLPDGTPRPAEVVGTDPSSDLAVVRVDATDLPVPAYAEQLPDIGEQVVAVGSPFGLEGSVTSGIVSALNRTLQTPGGAGLVDLVQTDAAINPGNSGGALTNARGEVIGINTAILSPSQANAGIGFAIPVTTAVPVADQLIEHGKVTPAFLGVRLQDVDPQTAELYGLGVTEGAIVAQVIPGSPADEAGLERGDIITAIDGEPVDGGAELAGRVRRHTPDDEVSLTVVRGGDERTVKVRLAAPPRE